MKPFDLSEAKAGKLVCTRDGRDVRIVCWDLKCPEYPLVGLVQNENGEEDLDGFSISGKYFVECDDERDLFMKEEQTVKREAYINIRKNEEGKYFCDGILHESQDAAKNAQCNAIEKVVKVEWEEEICEK